MTESLSTSQARKARAMFITGKTPVEIGAALRVAVDAVSAITTARDEIVLRIYASTSSVERAARAAGIGKPIATEILERHNIKRHVGSPPRAVPKPAPTSALPTYLRQPSAPKDAIAFEDLNDKRCRYPFGDATPFKFCGAATRIVVRGGESVRDIYCADHRALCSVPLPAKKQAA